MAKTREELEKQVEKLEEILAEQVEDLEDQERALEALTEQVEALTEDEEATDETDEVDDLIARVQTLEKVAEQAPPLRKSPTESLSEDRFVQVSADDKSRGDLETKHVTESTVVGTSLGVQMSTNNAAAAETRSGKILVSELLTEVAAGTGIDLVYFNGFQIDQYGSQTGDVLEGSDWRDRIIYWRFLYDTEPTAEDWPDGAVGQKYLAVSATGHITLFTRTIGSDSFDIWIDGDADGELKITTVDGNSFLDVVILVEATGALFGS